MPCNLTSRVERGSLYKKCWCNQIFFSCVISIGAIKVLFRWHKQVKVIVQLQLRCFVQLHDQHHRKPFYIELVQLTSRTWKYHKFLGSQNKITNNQRRHVLRWNMQTMKYIITKHSGNMYNRYTPKRMTKAGMVHTCCPKILCLKVPSSSYTPNLHSAIYNLLPSSST